MNSLDDLLRVKKYKGPKKLKRNKENLYSLRLNDKELFNKTI